MKIEDYIPEGRANAISREELVLRTGLPDRQVRKMIETARETGCIINLQDGEGYYIPTKEERIDVQTWYRAQRSRAIGVLKSLKGAEQWLAENPGDQLRMEV